MKTTTPTILDKSKYRNKKKTPIGDENMYKDMKTGQVSYRNKKKTPIGDENTLQKNRDRLTVITEIRRKPR
ncbi:hypothetical protein GCWU000282_01841 [Catonella morbi ATCC 51271]|uniref:Uncharacterized protein n=1 Tax=Catonella morbi ATCC 51271 TaxID=592026 RepID=V2Z7Q9_9FIRM|nr:hypothetical protein GCWU000282_01841 [Catonella morbi ATCC 51271]